LRLARPGPGAIGALAELQRDDVDDHLKDCFGGLPDYRIPVAQDLSRTVGQNCWRNGKLKIAFTKVGNEI
jgi:hypothetical protein